MRLTMFLSGFLLCSLPLHLHAQLQSSITPTSTCEVRDWHDNSLYTVAVPKQEVQPVASLEKINPSPNGAVVVHGVDRGDVLVHACIHASAPSGQEAQSLASQIQISKGAGDIEPTGPESDHDHHWSVSYEIWLPRNSNLEARTVNGRIKVEDVKGDIDTENVNGGMELDRLGGKVKSRTVNGGVKAELAGATWDGQGLEIKTTNGGIRLVVPATYSANVDTSTVNGGIHCDFPVSIQGNLTKHMSFQLGGGGPEIRTSTVNGGIHFSKST